MQLELGAYSDIIYFVGGLVALFLGGRLLVNGALSIGQITKISPLFIGLVIVAFGTSAPELFVSFRGVLAGQPDLAVGNIVGSNIANILLVLGLGALISPIAVRASMVFRDGLMMVLATFAFVWIARETAVFSQFEGTILTGALVIFILMAFVVEQLSESSYGERVRDWASLPEGQVGNIIIAVLSVVAGSAILYFGSIYLIDGSANLARRVGVSEAVIGLSILAIGTSLPELAATIVAAWRRHGELVVGNILGSNIFNILAVMGITSLFHEVSINARISHLDMNVMLFSALVLIPFMITRWQLSRMEGALFLVGYVAYMTVLFTEGSLH